MRSSTDGDRLKNVLSLVSKPVRYLGSEVNSVQKDLSQVRLKFCLAFPDAYEVGMSHLGTQILYHVLNQREWIACERAFSPWVDMEKVLRERSIPLSSLESSLPLQEFDIIGFSLQYEMCFTNVLNMLDLSKIPFLSTERDDRFPLIIAGGPCAFNPAPTAEFFDAIVIGDGEEVILEICDLVIQWKGTKAGKGDLLNSLSQLDGVYVPALATEETKVRKRIVSDLDQAVFPTRPIVPYMKVVHDRLNVEIARGCKRGCRFCEAGFIHRPYRERSPGAIEEILKTSLKGTGYEEISLLSLSAGDYSCIGPLLSTLMNRFESKKIAVSFPSLRIESVVADLAEEIRRVRKTGFTIAPEAATDRLRKVINKGIDEAVLFQGLEDLFSKGWKNVKLYFMIGLPSEKEEDLRGIIDLSRRISLLGERKKLFPNISVSISSFVPKPHTPFQWESQISLEEMKEKLDFLREGLKRGRLRFKWQDPHLSQIEGIFSVGDRNLSRVLVEAHRLGSRFDGWSDQFHHNLWREAFEKAGIDMNSLARKRGIEEALPWGFVQTGVDQAFLWEEFQKSLRGEMTGPCTGKDCHQCGICDGKTIRVRENLPEQVKPPERAGNGRIRIKKMKKKVRLQFAKEGDARFISHLELAHLFHRASKRAELPICYSEGFHPMPRIIFASALQVGVESLNEVVDMELEGGITPLEVMERLNHVLPRGIKITGAAEAPFSPSSSRLERSIYWILLDHLLPREEVVTSIEKSLEKREILIHQERKGKIRKVDVRPLIEKMDVKDENSGCGVELVLRKREGRTAKPTEIVAAILGLEEEQSANLKIVKIE